MSTSTRLVKIDNCEFEVTEDEDRVYFTEISDRIGKVHFTFSKNKKDNEEAEYGLRVFFTELFS